MTEIREQIAKGNPHPKDEDTTFLTEVGLHDAYMAGVDAALADAKIKEGQKLREKAKSGKLVELGEDQSTPSKTIRNTPDPLTGGLDDFDRGGQDMAERMKTAGFRRVKVKG